MRMRGPRAEAYLSDDAEQSHGQQRQDVTACGEVLEINVPANISFNSTLLCHDTSRFDLQDE